MEEIIVAPERYTAIAPPLVGSVAHMIMWSVDAISPPEKNAKTGIRRLSHDRDLADWKIFLGTRKFRV